MTYQSVYSSLTITIHWPDPGGIAIELSQSRKKFFDCQAINTRSSSP